MPRLATAAAGQRNHGPGLFEPRFQLARGIDSPAKDRLFERWARNSEFGSPKARTDGLGSTQSSSVPVLPALVSPVGVALGVSDGLHSPTSNLSSSRRRSYSNAPAGPPEPIERVVSCKPDPKDISRVQLREAVMRVGTASGRGPRDQSNQLTKFHYTSMRKVGANFINSVALDEPRHLRTTVGAAIYRPGQQAENLYGMSITTGSKVIEDIAHSKTISSLFGTPATQTLYNSTRGLIG